MTPQILFQIFLFGLALSADAFSVAVALSLNMSDLNRKRMVFIAFIFGLFQGLFPLTGYWLVEGVSQIVGSTAGKQAGDIMSTVVTWVAFGLLLIIGFKMLIESIKELRSKEEGGKDKPFSAKEVLWLGVVTAIDALASGVAFHNADASGVSMSNNVTIWLHIAIIMVVTFVLSLLGVIFGSIIEKLLKGKVGISGIVGGCILIFLAIYIVLSHYLIG